jgi:hypothetical protein
MSKLGLLLVLLLSSSALAESAPAHPEPVEGSASTTPSLSQPTVQPRKASFFRLFGIGAATTAVITPLSLGLGAWIGTWSSNLYAALIPALLIAMLVPPIVTALVEYGLGNLLWGKGTFKLGWSLLTGILVQVAMVVISVFVGIPAGTPVGAFVFTLFDIVLMGGSTSGIMWATKVEPTATVANRDEREGRGSVGSMDLPRAPAAAMTVRF